MTEKNPKKARRRGPFRQWKEEDMVVAYESVLNDGMSVHKAANIFSVPRKSLDDRVKGKVAIDFTVVRRLSHQMRSCCLIII